MEGKIIEYIEQGRFVCALCINKKANKLHLLTATNREINLSTNRVILVAKKCLNISRPREELLGYIKKAEKEREELQKKVNVRELWELVRDESEVFDNKDLAQLVFGENINDAHVSALMRALFEDRTYFKFKNGLFTPNSEERVNQIIKQREEETLKKERIEKGSKWIRDIMNGKEVERPDFADYIVKLLTQIFLFGKEASDYETGAELLSKAGISDPHMIRKFLVKIGVWDEDENIEIIKRGIPVSFSSKVKEEVLKLRNKPLRKEREDLRHLHLFTIDGEDTKDFDDALSIEVQGENILLGIHIADVSDWIEPDSVLDKEAKRRGTSCYLPRRQIPMFPPELSHDLLSLKKGEDRLALSLFVEMDKEGNILRYRFVPSIIRVKEQLTYNIVDKELNRDQKLRELYRLANILRQERIRKGGLDISLPEIKIVFEDKEPPNISVELIPQNTPAHIIVAEFMILYNWLAAKLCMEHNIPILFRTQEKPVEIIPKQDGINELYYIFQQRRRLGPMNINTIPGPHHALGLNVYTHATSPLRRYLDLVVQRQIKSLLMGKKQLYDTKQLEEIKMEVEPVIRDIQIMTRNRLRYWILKYLGQHLGKSYKAIVLDELRNRYRVVMCDFLLVAEIRHINGIILSPGKEIMVKVKRVDPWKDILELEYDKNKT